MIFVGFFQHNNIMYIMFNNIYYIYLFIQDCEFTRFWKGATLIRTEIDGIQGKFRKTVTNLNFRHFYLWVHVNLIEAIKSFKISGFVLLKPLRPSSTRRCYISIRLICKSENFHDFQNKDTEIDKRWKTSKASLVEFTKLRPNSTNRKSTCLIPD